MRKKYRIMKHGLKSWKIETSKLILLISYTVTITLTVIVVIGAFTDYSMEWVTQIALASYAEVSASNIYYYKKACRENIFKHMPKDALEQVDVNNLL